jgi:hypothetical protein
MTTLNQLPEVRGTRQLFQRLLIWQSLCCAETLRVRVNYGPGGESDAP